MVPTLNEQRDTAFLDWMFDREDKLSQFKNIVDHMEKTYKEDNNDWIVAVSFGKDSSLVLQLVMTMLLRLNEITKKVYIVTADTLVESPIMSEYIGKNVKLLQSEKWQGLGLEVIEVQPSIANRFFYQVIGKGLGAPAGNSRFNWCQHKLKIQPMNEAIEHILANRPFTFSDQPYEATLLLGTRLDESTRRANSIKKFEVDEYFGKHAYYSNIRTYSPIKFVETNDLWNYLDFAVGDFAWGLPVSSLREQYEDGKECPIIRSANDKACGGLSRNGCYTCLMAGRRDQMLEGLIAKGHHNITPLYEWKQFLYDISNDCRNREPLRRKEYEQTINDQSYSILDLIGTETPYKRAKKGNKDGEYRPGGFAFPIRKVLLEKLLYVEQASGYRLIDDEEINAILTAWSEDGYNVSRADLKPINHLHDGTNIIFKPDWTLNERESTFSSPMFKVEYYFKYEVDQLVEYYKSRQHYTKQHIFCYFDHEEVIHNGLICNKVVFFVCAPDVWCQQDADKMVADFLYLFGEETIGTNGKPFTKMTEQGKQAAIQHLLLSAFLEGNQAREK